jgi:hypothetical protein
MSGAAVEIDIQRFDVAEMCRRREGHNPTVGFFGARGSGKSVMMKDILHQFHLSGVPRVCVFSGTESQNSYFESIVPGFCIHSPVTAQAITDVFEAQKQSKMRQELGLIDKDLDLRLIVVLDDIAFDKKLLNSKVLSEICLNGRHSDIIMMLSVQYLMDLSVGARSNIDYAFFQADFSKKNRERIFQQFGGTYEDFKLFNAVFSACTVDYESFVLPGKNSGSDKPEHNSFYYKADFNLQFSFGSDEMWRFHKRKYLSPGEKYLTQLKEADERQRALEVTAALMLEAQAEAG